MIKTCAMCGKAFEVKKYAKYCPDCRPEAYRQLKRNWKKKQHVAKSKHDPKKDRLAYLRKCLEQAQTPEIRSRYFRQYVLLKQELLRGVMS